MTVDEGHGRDNGEYFLAWYASGFVDRTIITDGNHYLYGSFFNALGAVAARISPFGPFETRHFLIALTGLAGIFLTWRTAELLGGALAGFLAAVFLAATPVFFGHMFMNPKDMPFAVLSLAATYLLLRAYDRLPALPWRTVLAVGIVIGLGLGVRIGALMLLGYAVVLASFWILAAHWPDGRPTAPGLRESVAGIGVSLARIFVVAWTVMLVWWPYAQLNPLLNPLRAFRRAANFTDFPADVLYGGRYIPSSALPLDYIPGSFLITLPEYYAIALIGGCLALAALLIGPRARPHLDRDAVAKLAFLLFTILFPLATIFLLRPILYDANRHFLFIVPPLAVLAALSLALVFRTAAPKFIKSVVAVAIATSLVLTVADMIRLHPYQYIFYNRAFGGLPAARGQYETDYWGQSHKEGVEWLIKNHRPGAPPASIRVATPSAGFQASYHIERAGNAAERFVSVEKNEQPDLMLAVTRWDTHLKYPGKVLHVVKRDGVPLLYVIETGSYSRPASK
ncbi:MAG: ArnT family glycosyltransferase [Gemmatimonadaceae bacterium]